MAILGIDEVGRGPLAGPLVVGAVILPESRSSWVEELKDSKKLSAKVRERLSEVILAETATGLGWVDASELDVIGISEALRVATRRAVKEVQGRGVAFSQIVIDGKVNFLRGTALEGYVSVMPKADDLVKEVSAASIIAKVARDKYMHEVAEKYPGYGFEKHVGYGTAAHMTALKELGICPEHRRSFEPIKSMVGYERAKSVVKNITSIGMKGETAVCEYLVREGHEILERNFKTYFYEIDIVSRRDGVVYLTEVKTRKSDYAGGGLAAIDNRKLTQMRYAAESYLKYKHIECDIMLAVAAVDGDYNVVDWLPVK